jgi:hypothetical protein
VGVEEVPLFVGFIDSNCTSDLDDQKSTIGYVFNISSRLVTWDYK